MGIREALTRSFGNFLGSFFPVTVGTQAAVLAGLDITMFIEFQPPETMAWVRRNALI